MGGVPVGYAIGAVFMAVFVWLGLRPRPTNGPRATPSFVLASVASEVPVLMLVLVAAPTALAAAEGDLDSLAGKAVLAVALLTAAGIVISVLLAARTVGVLGSALQAGLGPGVRVRPWPGAGEVLEDADTRVRAAVGLHGYYGAAGDGSRASSPDDYRRPDAPPIMVIHGARDPMVPVTDARTFAARPAAVSRSLVVRAELPGGLHTFDRFASIRSAGVAAGVEAFAEWAAAGRDDAAQ